MNEEIVKKLASYGLTLVEMPEGFRLKEFDDLLKEIDDLNTNYLLLEAKLRNYLADYKQSTTLRAKE